jgi:hypothetical protein
VVDAQPLHATQRGTHGVDERLVPGGAELPGHERRQSPSLPLVVELVGRRTDPHTAGEQCVVLGGVGPAGCEAHGQVADDGHAGRGHLGELLGDERLQPVVEAGIRQQWLARLVGPAPRVGPEAFASGVPHRDAAGLGRQAVVGDELCPEVFAFACPHGVAVDQHPRTDA